MKTRITILTALLAAALMASGCDSDTSPLKGPNASGTTDNDGVISQNNFTILFDNPTPSYYDPTEGGYTAVTVEVSVQIGDNANQLITGRRTIEFRTEWGLIDPSCTTNDTGTCSVIWRSGSPDTMPENFLNTIVALSRNGQESYGDLNGNGLFDEGDTFNTDIFTDVEEPFVNVDESFDNLGPTFTTGDIIIDTINGVDLTGADNIHNPGDGLFNGPNCAHPSLCSTERTAVAVWESGSLLLNGGEVFAVGGAITGLTEDLIIDIDGTEYTILSGNTDYEFQILAGTSYTITVVDDGTLSCVISNSSGTPTEDVTDADISCT